MYFQTYIEFRVLYSSQEYPNIDINFLQHIEYSFELTKIWLTKYIPFPVNFKHKKI